MEMSFSQHWRALALRGIVGVIFGILVFLWPRMTLTALVILFGLYALIDGVLAVASGTQQRVREQVLVLGVEGLVGIGVGLTVLTWTGGAARVLVQLIAIWAILTGALEIVAANRLRQEIPGELFLLLAGIASMLLGVTMLLWPSAGPLVYIALLGSYALFFGTALVLVALRMRRTVAIQEHLEHELKARDRPVS